MKAWVTREPWSDRYEVRMVADAAHPSRVVRIEGSTPVYERTEEGAIVEPFLTLNRDEVEALAEALRDERKPDASADALQDARTMRDRLLALIEKSYQ